jgi:two-component system chemotaxis response regulator CheB
MRGRESNRRTASASRPAAGERLAVVAVCDQPLVRQLVATALSKEPDVAISTAIDWRHAERRLRSGRVDVALLCSESLWPDDEGAHAFRERKVPLVVGSIDVRGGEVQTSLLDLIARVKEARPKRSGRPPSSVRSIPPENVPYLGHEVPATPKLVVMGASAGGTMALKSIFQSMPRRSPAMLVVQHMSAHFTGTFAQGLARISSLSVREAEEGDVLVEGTALIAPGDRHIVVVRRGQHYVVAFAEGPPVSRHRPSVNVLFRSVAQEGGPNAIGVILTGMGDDGADGLFEMKELGSFTIAQNEATSVVFGMPRAAILRGGVQQVASLAELPGAILKSAGYRTRSTR